jgi:hypothetical protein
MSKPKLENTYMPTKKLSEKFGNFSVRLVHGRNFKNAVAK